MPKQKVVGKLTPHTTKGKIFSSRPWPKDATISGSRTDQYGDCELHCWESAEGPGILAIYSCSRL